MSAQPTTPIEALVQVLYPKAEEALQAYLATKLSSYSDLDKGVVSGIVLLAVLYAKDGIAPTSRNPIYLEAFEYAKTLQL